MPRTYDEWEWFGKVHNSMRQRVFDELRSVNPENVFTFHLRLLDETKKIQLHSKLMIVDDRYVCIGTANFNYRSHGSDSEINVAVVDEETEPRVAGGDPNDQVGKFPRALRVAIGAGRDPWSATQCIHLCHWH